MSQTSTSGFTIFEAGPLSEWYERHQTEHPASGLVKGKFWVKEALGLTGMELSVGSLPAGQGVPFLHAHQQNEELYLFLSGSGEMLLDGQRIPVGPGTLVKVDPPVSRSWRNTGSEPLIYLVTQTKAGSLEQWTKADGLLTGPDPWQEN